MLYTDSHGPKEHFAKDPAVIRLGDTYYLYHSSFIAGKDPGDKDRLIVAIAMSKDMEHWTFVDFVPLTQECEQNGIGAPAAYLENGVVHLFYQTYGNRERDAICHATSVDGIHFEKDPTNPIFHPTNDWCCGRAIDADVVAFDGKLFLYFATRDKDFKIQMQGCAYAPLGSDYSREQWTQAVNAPILSPELPWEGKCIEAAATLTRNGKVFMFYGGAYNCAPQQIGYAVSEDGVHFEKPHDIPFLPCGKAGDWNASESGHPYVFEDTDGRIYLFYQGSPNGGKAWIISRCEIGFHGDEPYIIQLHNEPTECVP